MAVLEARGITHRYGERVVLREVSLSVPAGARYAVVGPNGSGKTTLLRLLARLERPSQGEVTATRNGGPVTADLDFRRCVAMVLQRPFLFHTTVLGNVLYGLRARGMGLREAKEKALGALAEAGLAALQRRPARAVRCNELSGGGGSQAPPEAHQRLARSLPSSRILASPPAWALAQSR